MPAVTKELIKTWWVAMTWILRWTVVKVEQQGSDIGKYRMFATGWSPDLLGLDRQLSRANVNSTLETLLYGDSLERRYNCRPGLTGFGRDGDVQIPISTDHKWLRPAQAHSSDCPISQSVSHELRVSTDWLNLSTYELLKSLNRVGRVIYGKESDWRHSAFRSDFRNSKLRNPK